jgi:uncharacterized repeat protein (TIGR01451 family)
MGTRANSRDRRRATRRGAASFVSFLLLFAFALGQSSLSALADDAGTDPVAAEDLLSDGSTDEATLPVEEAPAEEAPAEEAPAEEAPAEEAPVADEGDGGSAAVTDDGSSSAPSARTGQVNVARVKKTTALAAPAAPPGGSLDGGDIDLDFIAAGPFTYDHATGLGTYPQFGYNDRNISKSNGVVESLESGDFACGDYVTFFTQITVDSGAASGGTIELDYTYGAETTGQPGLGFSDIIDVDVNKPDDGNKNLDGDEVATLIAEGFDSSGYDQVTGTVQIEGLDPGDVVIVRSIVELTCFQGDSPTGNILSAIETGRVTSPEDDTIQVGQQTVPMKTTGFVAEPAIDIEKTCPAEAAFGDDITYDITITNNGNEDLENIVVTDTVNGNAADDISDLFADSLIAGASDSAQYVYSPDANDPDPLPNTVTVTADGVHSSTQVTDTDTCDTDITHEPGIDVTKSCPESVPFGEDIEYTITVENTGNEALVGVTVDDTLLGDITGDFDVDFSNPFPVGGLATAVVSYTPQAGDPDPITNTVTATGNGEDSGAQASDEASCETDILNPSIGVTKSCTALAHAGDTVTYTITVTNTGDEDLDGVTVVDTILGDLSASFANELAAGASESQDFDYVVLESDPDPLVNEVTAKGSGVGSRVAVEALANCATDLIHPAIEIVKTVDEDTVPIGTTVTFTYVVTNTGDTTLYDISVDDDILGHIGDIAVLEPGESATLTKDFVVGDEIVTNVATAEGEDILGRSVSANDSVTVFPIAGENPPEPPTPFTGSDAARLGIISLVLFGIGATVVATTRRRRPGREVA